MADNSQAILCFLVLSAADGGTVYQIPLDKWIQMHSCIRYWVLSPPFIESSRKLLPYIRTSPSLVYLL